MLDSFDLSDPKSCVAWFCSNCRADCATLLADLLLGGEGGNPDVINLPLCACGTQSSVYRTWDSHPEADSTNRRAINSLATYLHDAGQIRRAALRKHERPHYLHEDAQVSDLTLRAARRKAADRLKESLEARAVADAESRRRILAAVAVIKRLGLKLEDEIPEDALAAELAKPADEILAALPASEPKS